MFVVRRGLDTKRYPLVQLVHGCPSALWRFLSFTLETPGVAGPVFGRDGELHVLGFGQEWVESILGAHPTAVHVRGKATISVARGPGPDRMLGGRILGGSSQLDRGQTDA